MQLAIAILFILLIWIFLIMPRRKNREEVQNFYSIPFAHRGFFNLKNKIPENSLKAFEEAEKNNYSVEFDVRLTLDKKLAVVHDENLKRLCNINLNVSESTYSQIKELRLCNTDESIPLLTEVLKVFSGDFPLIVELKSEKSNYKILCEKAFEVLDNYNGKFMIQSFDPRIIRWLKKNRPNVLRGQLSGVDSKINGKFSFGKAVFAFLLNNLLSNFLTSPDYIAYKLESRRNLSFMLCKCIYKVPVAYWTIRNKKDYLTANYEHALKIFEGFRV